jgi:hypothetical protein
VVAEAHDDTSPERRRQRVPCKNSQRGSTRLTQFACTCCEQPACARRGRRARQSSPSTVRSASSTDHSSSWVRCLADRPSRCGSTAPTCSTSTRVETRPTRISGRKDAGRALVDVGATMTTERGRSASACSTTAKRAPRCSWPRRELGLNRSTSPLRTHGFHECCDFAHLRSVSFVCLKGGGLGGEVSPLTEPFRRVDEGGADRF